MSAGYKHFSRWSFGDWVWHKVTHDKGMILGIRLRAGASPTYDVVFEDNRNEMVCLQEELTDEQPTAIEAKPD